MTGTVTLRDGDADQYMRFGDTYVKHDDGNAQALSGSYPTGVTLAVLILPAAAEMDLAVTPPDSMSIRSRRAS
jgi:hypothetical protein